MYVKLRHIGSSPARGTDIYCYQAVTEDGRDFIFYDSMLLKEKEIIMDDKVIEIYLKSLEGGD